MAKEHCLGALEAQLRVLVVGVLILGPSNGAGGPGNATHGAAGPSG